MEICLWPVHILHPPFNDFQIPENLTAFTLSLLLSALTVWLPKQNHKGCVIHKQVFLFCFTVNVEITVLINSRSLLFWFPRNNKTCYSRIFMAVLVAAEGRSVMCIVSKRGIAFSLPFEIFIYIPILPHQHYNLLFHPFRFSLLTFLLFPPPISISCHLLLLPFIPLFCSSAPSSTYSLLSFPPPLFSPVVLILPSSRPFFYHCLPPLLPFSISNATRLLVPISHCVWLARPVFSRFQHLQEMSREL